MTSFQPESDVVVSNFRMIPLVAKHHHFCDGPDALLTAALCLADGDPEGETQKRECPLLSLCFVCFSVPPYLMPFWKSLQPSAQGTGLFLFAPCLSERTSIQPTNVPPRGDGTSPPSSQPGSGESSRCLQPWDWLPAAASWEEKIQTVLKSPKRSDLTGSAKSWPRLEG